MITFRSANTVTAFLALLIILVIIVQRNVTATRLTTLQFEAAKSVIATVLWLWLFIDSAAQARNRKQRLPRAAIASILLL